MLERNNINTLIPLSKIIPSKDPKKEQNNDDVEKVIIYKRIFSKPKRRFQDSKFDHNIFYTTEKIITIGNPSTGMETLYLNSLADIAKLFCKVHNNKVKVYNL